MKTYFIDGNTMHLAGSQNDISDSFFGSECPDSNATVAQRQDAIRFWLSLGWMDEGDVVVWDGVRYTVGGESPTLEKRMRAFLSAAEDNPDLIDLLDEAFRLSMVDKYPQASCFWLEGDRVRMDSFLSDEEAAAEMSRHAVAFIVPKSWHEKKECIWLWKEEDVESRGTVWCCDDGYGVAKFPQLEDVWEYVLDYLQINWLDEADAVIEYVGNRRKK